MLHGSAKEGSLAPCTVSFNSSVELGCPCREPASSLRKLAGSRKLKVGFTFASSVQMEGWAGRKVDICMGMFWMAIDRDANRTFVPDFTTDLWLSN